MSVTNIEIEKTVGLAHTDINEFNLATEMVVEASMHQEEGAAPGAALLALATKNLLNRFKSPNLTIRVLEGALSAPIALSDKQIQTMIQTVKEVQNGIFPDVARTSLGTTTEARAYGMVIALATEELSHNYDEKDIRSLLKSGTAELAARP